MSINVIGTVPRTILLNLTAWKRKFDKEPRWLDKSGLSKWQMEAYKLYPVSGIAASF